jgi:RHS repeat-associated protein
MNPLIPRILSPLLILAAFLVPPASAQVDPNLEQGLKLYGSYHGGDLDLVNVQNGHLTFRAPFYSLPQRGGKLNLSFSILYDNLIGAFVQATCLPPPHQATCTYAVRYYGSSAQIISDQGYTMIKNLVNSGQVDGGDNPILIPVFYLLGTDGAQHQLVYTTDGHYETIDGSNLRVDQTNGDFANPVGTLTDSNGIRQAIGSVFQSSPPIPVASSGFPSLEDQNGNQITYTSSTHTYTDTLGRNLNLTPGTGNVSSCPQLNFPYQSAVSASVLNFLAPNGGTMPVTLCAANVYIRSNACAVLHLPRCTDYSGYVSMLQSIILPNGTYWAFQYSAANPNDPNTAAYGNLLEVIFPTGGSITYTYGTTYGCALSPPSQATIGTPQVLTRTVNANDGTGPHTWTYNWTTQPNTVTDPLGQKVVHTFTGFGCSYYETLTQAYDASNNLLKTTKTDYTYLQNAVSNYQNTDLVAGVVPIRTTTTWPNGQVTKNETDYDTGFSYRDPTYYWVLSGSCPLCTPSLATYAAIFGKPIASRGYDYGPNAPGALLRQIKTAYQWQSNSNYLTTNLLDLPSSVITYDGNSNRMAEADFTYDNASYLTPSNITTQHQSAPGAVRGNLSTTARWLSTTGGSLTSINNTYDTGVTYESIDPLNNITKYLYSTTFAGAYPTTVTNALNQSMTYNYDFNTGLMTSVTDPNNQATTYSYDDMLRLSQANYPDGGKATIAYQETSFPVTATLTTLINTTLNLNKVQQRTFDGLGRVTQTALTSDPDGTDYTVTTYDALGRASQQYNPTRCSTPTTNCGETTWGYATTAYDALNRVTSVTPQDGSAATTTSYSGNTTTVTDSAGKKRESLTDGLGRLTQIFEDPTGLNYETDYAYDALNNLLCVGQKGSNSGTFSGCSSIPASWRPRIFTYDSLSRLTSATNPESNTITSTGTTQATTYTYDSDSNLLQKTSLAPGQTGSTTVTLSYCYDAINRVTGKAYTAQTCSNGLLPSPLVSYYYDQSSYSGLTITNGIGRRTGMADQAGTEAWSYDKMGRPLVDLRITNSLSKSTTYVYLPYVDGSVNTITYPSGRTVTYTTGAAEHALSAQDSSTSVYYANPAHYTPSGALSSLTNGAALYSTLLYNSRLQPCWFYTTTGTALATSTACTASDPTPGNILDLKYNFNLGSTDNGNVMGITNNRDTTRSQTFAYDALNRITTAETTSTYATSPANCWGESYFYDNLTAAGGAWGNLTSTSPASSAYTGCVQESNLSVSVSSNNRFSQSGYSYDSAGNLTAEGTQTFSYDAENHLVSTAGTNYVYDGDGRRVEKSVSGSVAKIYWYDPRGQVLDETDGSGSITNSSFNEYIFFDGQRIARRDSSNNAYYYIADHLGTSRTIAEIPSGQSTAALCYDADFYSFGGERPPIVNTCSQNYKFTGKERDAESGLDNFDFRHNSSSLGRFMSPDPLGGYISNPQSLNRYSYVLNNPLNLVDPLGLQCTSATMRDDHGNLLGSSSDCGSDVGTLPVGTAANLVPLSPGPSDSTGGEDLSIQATNIPSDNPNAGSATSNPGLDATQLGLGALGMIPGPVGTGANLVNAGISFYRGDYGQGALNLAFAIPLVGTIGRLGEAGELAAGIIKNTERIESFTGKAYRIPDELNAAERVIGEVKNVSYQAYTKQLRDYVQYAQKYGYEFRLYIKQGAKLSVPLQDAINIQF